MQYAENIKKIEVWEKVNEDRKYEDEKSKKKSSTRKSRMNELRAFNDPKIVRKEKKIGNVSSILK